MDRDSAPADDVTPSGAGAALAPALAPDPGLAPSRPRGRLVTVLRDRTFRALHVPDYRRYFTGQVVSLSGSWMQSAAVLWLVYAQTDDPRWPPLMLVAQTVPTILLGTWAGSLVDRVPRRRLIVTTQVSFLAVAAVLATLIASDSAGPWVLLTAQLANGCVQAVDLPARLAFVPSLVPRSVLGNAVALNSMVFNAARAVGPALAGGLFVLASLAVSRGLVPHSDPATLGAAWCVTLNGLSYLVVIAALLRITHAGVPPPAGPGRVSGVFAGVRAVANEPYFLGLLAGAGVLSASAWPALPLFPAYTVRALGHAVEEYSLLVSALGVGALAAALGNATFGSADRTRPFLLGGAVGAALGLAGLAFAHAAWAAALSAAVLGAGLVLHLSTAQSALQLSVPDALRGRVMALWPMALAAGNLLGNVLAGVAARYTDVRHVLAGLAVGSLAAAATRLALRRRGPAARDADARA